MLEQILEEIKKGNTLSPAVLASKLNTTPQMIEAMLSTLEMQGYLKPIQMECSTDKPCEACSLTGFCRSKTRRNPQIRVLQEKT